VGDVSVIHPGSLTYRRSAAQRPDAAAAHRGAAKLRSIGAGKLHLRAHVY
jgi:hypothetical protein